jgi:hypothetical protein
MSFVTPKWNAAEQHYVIETTEQLRAAHKVDIGRDSSSGSTVFTNENHVHDITVDMIHVLISEGELNKWFTKLPSHEQMMKRLRHTFSKLATAENTHANIHSILMTPKTLTMVWTPITVEKPKLPPMYFEDSDGDELNSDIEADPEIKESKLPPVELKDPSHLTKEEYLLTRLRAARARVETEEIKMQYFETTGKMPPDSESEEDDE